MSTKPPLPLVSDEQQRILSKEEVDFVAQEAVGRLSVLATKYIMNAVAMAVSGRYEAAVKPQKAAECECYHIEQTGAIGHYEKMHPFSGVGIWKDGPCSACVVESERAKDKALIQQLVEAGKAMDAYIDACVFAQIYDGPTPMALSRAWRAALSSAKDQGYGPARKGDGGVSGAGPPATFTRSEVLSILGSVDYMKAGTMENVLETWEEQHRKT